MIENKAIDGVVSDELARDAMRVLVVHALKTASVAQYHGVFGGHYASVFVVCRKDVAENVDALIEASSRVCCTGVAETFSVELVPQKKGAPQ